MTSLTQQSRDVHLFLSVSDSSQKFPARAISFRKNTGLSCESPSDSNEDAKKQQLGKCIVKNKCPSVTSKSFNYISDILSRENQINLAGMLLMVSWW